eukprot:1119420-Pleurochrysis_carterae.AAC.1
MDRVNLARIQIKMWIEKKNEHKGSVQRRWDNRGIMNETFKKWKLQIGRENDDKDGRKENQDDEGKREETHTWNEALG